VNSLNTDSFRVLVIDDDADVAQYIRLILERRAGCEAVAITDPSIAVETAEAFRPDVVVTDIEMPGTTGLDLITLLRAALPGLPVVVVTAHVSVDYAVRAMRSQANELLTKPIVSSELVAVVTRLALERRRSQEDAGELVRAAEVQRSLLPRQLMQLPGYEIAGGCKPAKAVGGDFFDWYPVTEGAVFSLADVMGKGMGAAIIAAMVRTVLRSDPTSGDLAATIAGAAEAIASDLDYVGTFVTVFHARLDIDSGEMRYIDAGHGLTILVRAGGGMRRLATTSLPLGSGLEDTWREHRVILAPGDTLVSVSDGVLDLFDGTLTSLDEVERLARSAPDAQGVVDSILGIAGSTADDDVTVVALRRLP
jgi:serine phosphatase RsbU (regulator of sigma subunit)